MTANYELCIMNYELNIRKATKDDAPLIATVVAMAIGEECNLIPNCDGSICGYSNCQTNTSFKNAYT